MDTYGTIKSYAYKSLQFRLKAEMPLTTHLLQQKMTNPWRFPFYVYIKSNENTAGIAEKKHIFLRSAVLQSSAIEVSISKGHAVIGSGDSTRCISVWCNQRQLTADVQSSAARAYTNSGISLIRWICFSEDAAQTSRRSRLSLQCVFVYCSAVLSVWWTFVLHCGVSSSYSECGGLPDFHWISFCTQNYNSSET